MRGKGRRVTTTIGDIQAGLEAALAALVTAGTVQAVDVVSRPRGSMEEHLARMGRQPPYLAVLYTGGPFHEVNRAAGVYLHEARFTAIMGVSGLGDPEDAREDAAGVAAALMNALHNQDLGLSIEPIRFGGGLQLLNWLDQVLLYGMDFSTEFEYVVSDEAG